MELGQSINILGSFIKFTFVENRGLAFSIKVSNLNIYTTISFFASIMIIYYLYKYKDEGWKVTIPLALILGGALGNLVDRIIYSKVVDFIDVGLGMWRWPVFNIADSAVSVGLVWFLIVSWYFTDETVVEEEVA